MTLGELLNTAGVENTGKSDPDLQKLIASCVPVWVKILVVVVVVGAIAAIIHAIQYFNNCRHGR